jgi:chemotaxis protein CheY-P-specific phosphatase CheC
MTELQNDVARELFSIGVASAAKSLAFFTQETMYIKHFDLTTVSGPNVLNFFNQATLDKNHILITELIGDFTGHSFLLLNQEEVDFMCHKMLPQSIRDKPEQVAMMTDNLLLELDNIVSAAVVTQFANLLSCKLHGGVPELVKAPFKDYLENQFNIEYNLYALLFNVRFTTGDLELEPSFVWFVDKEFFKHLEPIMSKVETLQKLINAQPTTGE